MKTTKYIYQIIFSGIILFGSNLCYGQNQVTDPVEKMKNVLLESDENPLGKIVAKTNDTNRTEVISILKQILNQNLGNSQEKGNAHLVNNAMLAFSSLNKGGDTVETLQPFLNYPNTSVQRTAMKYIAESGEPGALKQLQKKVEEAEPKLPDISSFTSDKLQESERLAADFFMPLINIVRMKTPESTQYYNDAIARFKKKYQGTKLGQKLIDSYLLEAAQAIQEPPAER